MSAGGNIPVSFASGSTAAAILSGPSNLQGVGDNPVAAAPSIANVPTVAKEDDNVSFLGRRPSPVPSEIGLGRGIGRGSVIGGASTGIPIPLMSVGGVSGSAGSAAVQVVSDVAKRNILGADERVASSGLSQPLASPLSTRTSLQQFSRTNDASIDSNNAAEGPVIGRVFSPSAVGGVQWRPQTGFPNQNDTVCICIFFSALCKLFYVGLTYIRFSLIMGNKCEDCWYFRRFSFSCYLRHVITPES